MHANRLRYLVNSGEFTSLAGATEIAKAAPELLAQLDATPLPQVPGGDAEDRKTIADIEKLFDGLSSDLALSKTGLGYSQTILLDFGRAAFRLWPEIKRLLALKPDATGGAGEAVDLPPKTSWQKGYDAGRQSLTAEVEYLRAQVKSPAPVAGVVPEGWQPIETAPNDQWILVWRPGSNVRDAAWFDIHGFSGWTEGRGGKMTPAPTHWMPLPAAPAAQGLDK